MNVAIVIGHAPDAKGAYSNFGIPQEYDYNLKVANELVKSFSDDSWCIFYEIFTHDTYRNGGYKPMQQRTAAKVNAKDFDLVLELHYNAASSSLAEGSLVLYHYASNKGKAYAELFLRKICQEFETESDGIRPAYNKYDNGYWFLQLNRPPALILEPFFGTNPKEVEKFKGQERKYAQAIHRAAIDIKTKFNIS